MLTAKLSFVARPDSKKKWSKPLKHSNIINAYKMKTDEMLKYEAQSKSVWSHTQSGSGASGVTFSHLLWFTAAFPGSSSKLMLKTSLCSTDFEDLISCGFLTGMRLHSTCLPIHIRATHDKLPPWVTGRDRQFANPVNYLQLPGPSSNMHTFSGAERVWVFLEALLVHVCVCLCVCLLAWD